MGQAHLGSGGLRRGLSSPSSIKQVPRPTLGRCGLRRGVGETFGGRGLVGPDGPVLRRHARGRGVSIRSTWGTIRKN